jgi:hypothetical protein
MTNAPHQDCEFTMNVNFWEIVYGVEAFVPRRIAAGQSGHVVNTASMVGLSAALHREFEPQGIGVSVLCPMIVATDVSANPTGSASDRIRHCVQEAISTREETAWSVEFPKTLIERQERLPDEASCWTFVRRERWPRVWLLAMFFFGRHKKGIYALQFQRDPGLGSYQTAWTLLHKLRSGLCPRAERDQRRLLLPGGRNS